MGNLAHNESYPLGHLFSLLSVKAEPVWKKMSEWAVPDWSKLLENIELSLNCEVEKHWWHFLSMDLALEDPRVSKWENFNKIVSLLLFHERLSLYFRKIAPQTAKSCWQMEVLLTRWLVCSWSLTMAEPVHCGFLGRRGRSLTSVEHLQGWIKNEKPLHVLS